MAKPGRPPKLKIPSVQTEEVRSELTRIANGIQELGKLWTPHPAQLAIGQAFIRDQVKEVFAQCGRNFGKSELVAYLLWRWAWSHSKSENYYFAPFMKQAREILWASRRIQDFGPKGWIKDVNNTEMRVTLTNGSFIKLDGSDNVDAYRGVKPKGLSVFDEFKDFRPEFYEAYDPNRAAHDTPLFIVGTPPDHDCQFVHVAAEYQRDKKKRFFAFPTEANPHISRDWLERKRVELYARGDGDQWEREYMARFVKGGRAAIFPMLNKQHVIPHDQLMRDLYRDKRKLEWILWADPAGASCFAVLFLAINPYSRKIYCLDEIYETDQAQMTVGKIGRRIFEMREDLMDYPGIEWRQGYDEAETWFSNEMLDLFNEHFEPSQKAKSDKLSGLALIKDALTENLFVMSDRCKKLYWEMENYRKDDSGKIKKMNDHLIDSLRYSLDAARYTVKDSPEPVPPEASPFWRGARPSDDFPEFSDIGEPTEELDF
jgi:hypothetical protein